MMFSPALNSKVQAKTIVQTIKDSKGNEDAKKLSSKLQYLFNNLRRVEYKDKIKESDGAKKLLKWLEGYFVNNKLEIENYINSNKEFSKEIATLYRSCLNKRKSVYSKYAAKFNMEIPTDIVAKPVVNKIDKEVTSVKPVINEIKKEVTSVNPVANEVEKKVVQIKPIANEVEEKATSINPVANEVVQVKSIVNKVEEKTTSLKPVVDKVNKKVTSLKPIANKVEKEVVKVKPVANEVKKKAASIKSVVNKVEKKVTQIKSVTNKDKKQNLKDLDKLPSKAKLPKTGSNVGGLALGFIGAITTMFGIVISKINRK